MAESEIGLASQIVNKFTTSDLLCLSLIAAIVYLAKSYFLLKSDSEKIKTETKSKLEEINSKINASSNTTAYLFEQLVQKRVLDDRPHGKRYPEE